MDNLLIIKVVTVNNFPDLLNTDDKTPSTLIIRASDIQYCTLDADISEVEDSEYVPVTIFYNKRELACSTVLSHKDGRGNDYQYGCLLDFLSNNRPMEGTIDENGLSFEYLDEDDL